MVEKVRNLEEAVRGPERRHRRVRGPVRGRRHRRRQGDPLGAAERGVDRRAVPHHRGGHRRQARGEVRARHARRRDGRLLSPTSPDAPGASARGARVHVTTEGAPRWAPPRSVSLALARRLASVDYRASAVAGRTRAWPRPSAGACCTSSARPGRASTPRRSSRAVKDGPAPDDHQVVTVAAARPQGRPRRHGARARPVARCGRCRPTLRAGRARGRRLLRVAHRALRVRPGPPRGDEAGAPVPAAAPGGQAGVLLLPDVQAPRRRADNWYALAYDERKRADARPRRRRADASAAGSCSSSPARPASTTASGA